VSTLNQTYAESRQHLEKWAENMAHELGLDVIRNHIRVVLTYLDVLEGAVKTDPSPYDPDNWSPEK
jgi:hypothetical protein